MNITVGNAGQKEKKIYDEQEPDLNVSFMSIQMSYKMIDMAVGPVMQLQGGAAMVIWRHPAHLIISGCALFKAQTSY